MIEPSAGGATDHGQLTGLGDDDHPQYLDNTRGDARYVNLTGDVMSANLEFSHPAASIVFQGADSGVRWYSNDGWLTTYNQGGDVGMADGNGMLRPLRVADPALADQAATRRYVDAALPRDTGARNITSMLLAGWGAGAADGVFIRRSGNTVFLSVIDLYKTTASPGALAIADAPSGFAPDVRFTFGVQPCWDSTAFGLYPPASTPNLVVMGAGAWLFFLNMPAQPSLVSGLIVYPTSAPWPTTLPGTPG